MTTPFDDDIRYTYDDNLSIPDLDYERETMSIEGNGIKVEWSVSDLWEAVKGQPPTEINFDVLREHLDTSLNVYRVMKADVSYPIILSRQVDSEGNPIILDGYHRLNSLFYRCASRVKVQYIETMPKPKAIYGDIKEIASLNVSIKPEDLEVVMLNKG